MSNRRYNGSSRAPVAAIASARTKTTPKVITPDEALLGGIHTVEGAELAGEDHLQKHLDKRAIRALA